MQAKPNEDLGIKIGRAVSTGPLSKRSIELSATESLALLDRLRGTLQSNMTDGDTRTEVESIVNRLQHGEQLYLTEGERQPLANFVGRHIRSTEPANKLLMTIRGKLADE